jgi:hypothetical protein
MPSPVFALKGKKSDPGVTNVRLDVLLSKRVVMGAKWQFHLLNETSEPWLPFVSFPSQRACKQVLASVMAVLVVTVWLPAPIGQCDKAAIRVARQ